MIPQVFGEEVMAHAGPVPITATMVTSTVVSLALVATGTLLARLALVRPESRTASTARLAHGALERLVVDAAGTRDPAVSGIAVALFAFIAGSAMLGQLPGIRPPTANIETTSALAIVVFLAVPILGVARRGLRAYLRGYFRPNPLFAPLHLVSEVSRTLALALRLFGNMMSGHLVVALLVALAGLLVPVPLMALDLLIGVLQAYIFTVLACVYLGAALGAGEST
ncbi:MAG TPA: F0F1 ATP synthase subunit A [Polyangiaceae bacterium]|nr:F0F1 ATP synthase subunit A [Polyangiaceae bacterium]